MALVILPDCVQESSRVTYNRFPMSCNWQLGGKVILYNKFYDANKFLCVSYHRKNEALLLQRKKATIVLTHYFMQQLIVQRPW